MEIYQIFPGYQANYENSWWRRVELRYGNNPKNEGDEKLESLLKWAIRSQASKSANDKDMMKVQRLNASGSEVIDHYQ